MTKELIEVELNKTEKLAILKYAEFVILEEITVTELKKQRNRWVHFSDFDLEQIIAELIHYCRSVEDDKALMFFDELTGHLENAQNRGK